MGNEVLICKRCGKPIYRLEYRRKGNRVYVYAEHREVLPDGKVRFYYHYLGPADKYKYVAMLHEDTFPTGLYGYTYEFRRPRYLKDLTDQLNREMQAHMLSSKEAREFIIALEGLCPLLGELRQYAEIKAREEQEQAKAMARQNGGEGE